MTYVLILIFFAQGGVSQHDYNSQAACQQALATAKSMSIYTYGTCVPKGE